MEDKLRKGLNIPEEPKAVMAAFETECDFDEDDPMKAIEEVLRQRSKKVCCCMDQAG